MVFVTFHSPHGRPAALQNTPWAVHVLLVMSSGIKPTCARPLQLTLSVLLQDWTIHFA